MNIDLKKNGNVEMNCEIKAAVKIRGLVLFVFCFTDIKNWKIAVEVKN